MVRGRGGATGPTGPTGATGPSGEWSSQYAHIATTPRYEVAFHDLLPLQENVILSGDGIVHRPGDQRILLPAGDYLVNYRTTACCQCACQYQGIRVELEVNGSLYPGGAADAIAWGLVDTNLGGAAILSSPDADLSIGLLNGSGVSICFSNTSITVVKLR